MATALGSEQWAVIGVVDPDANTAAAYDTDEIDMSKWHRVMAVVQTGILGASATIDFKFQDSATSGGSFADVSGKSITQLVKADDDDKQAIVNLRYDELNDSARYAKGVLTVGTATSDCSCVILGQPRYAPASDNDLASVDEIVA